MIANKQTPKMLFAIFLDLEAQQKMMYITAQQLNNASHLKPTIDTIF